MIKVLLYSFLVNSIVYVLHPCFHVWSFMQGNSLNNWVYSKRKNKKGKKRGGGEVEKGRDILNAVGLNLFFQENLVRLSYSVRQPLCMLNYLTDIIRQWVWLIFQASLILLIDHFSKSLGTWVKAFSFSVM